MFYAITEKYQHECLFIIFILQMWTYFDREHAAFLF